MADTMHFGHFEIRFDQRQLLVRGREANLGSRAFDVLQALVERRERLVPKSELLDLVWPGVVVEENNLQVQVSALRKLLGPQAIATVPGRGYRFTAVPSAAAAGGAGSAGDAVDAGRAGGGAVPGAGAGAATPAPPPPAAAAAGAPGTVAARLLVAEDNKVNRLLLGRSLEQLGHGVHSVDNGRKALEALRQERFDLVLLDIEMPELDGFAVLEALARDTELRDLPVIVTSSLEGVAHVARCIELGADDYLRKPVNPVLLKARVGASLEKRRLREQQKELIRRLSATALPEALPAADLVATEPARVAATVLAARLRGVAELVLAQPAEETIGLLDSCHTLMREAIEGHGGQVFEGASDGLMAVFTERDAPVPGPPGSGARARPGAPLAAARAALEMAEMLEVFDAERASAGKPGIGVRIGIASGEVVVGQTGAPRQARRVCLGPPVPAAAQLQAQAQVGTWVILVDTATQRALDARVATEPVRALHEEGVHAVRTG